MQLHTVLNTFEVLKFTPTRLLSYLPAKNQKLADMKVGKKIVSLTLVKFNFRMLKFIYSIKQTFVFNKCIIRYFFCRWKVWLNIWVVSLKLKKFQN